MKYSELIAQMKTAIEVLGDIEAIIECISEEADRCLLQVDVVIACFDGVPRIMLEGKRVKS